MSLTARLVAVGLVLLALSAAAWRVYYKIDAAGYARAMTEVAAVQAKQAEDNRKQGREAEVKYITRTQVQTKIINQVVKEIEYVTKNLADCRLEPAAIVLLNRAASAISADTSPSDTADSLPGAGTPAK